MRNWSSIQEISSRLKELRLKAGLTQGQLAELADTDEKFVQQIEAARKKQIWVSTVDQLAQALGVELHEFFNSDCPEPRLSKPNKGRKAK